MLNTASLVALLFIVSYGTRVASEQLESAILDMFVDCIEFEKLCDQLRPCEHEAKCSPTYDDDGYKCDCPLGYGGKNCHMQLSECNILPSLLTESEFFGCLTSQAVYNQNYPATPDYA